jgi:hypothetical protein
MTGGLGSNLLQVSAESTNLPRDLIDQPVAEGGLTGREAGQYCR